jgi:hypothetical protein
MNFKSFHAKYCHIGSWSVATVGLMQGKCDVSKNGSANGSIHSSLCYDQDLGFFKVIGPQGDTWASFTSSQIVDVRKFETGQLFKSLWLTVRFKSPNGDEYELKYKASTVGALEDASKWLDYASRKDGASDEIILLMKTRERVAFEEVCTVLAKRGLPASEVEARKILEYGISSKRIDGVLEGSRFVSRSALQREQARYEIVSNSDFSGPRAISFRCRSCGRSLPLDGKQQSGKCEYCGTPYALPKKLLDLV